MRLYLALIYIFINSLFLYKYGLRLLNSKVYLLVLGYILFVYLLFKLLEKNKIREKINSFKGFNILYFMFTILFITVIFLINKNVNSESLNVDRWSALTVGIESYFKGNYPYTAIDHLGGRTSNLPGLFLIGTPFYVLGDIGYLQVVTYLLLSYTIFVFYKSNFQKLLAVLLFLLSPAFYWEVFVKSDLMSNFIIVLVFIILWHKFYSDNAFKRPVLLGVLVSILFLTRLIILIPLVLFLFKPFVKAKYIEQVKFIFSFTLFSVILILPIVLSAQSIQQIIEYNPLVLQTSQVPFFLSVVFLILPFTVFYFYKSLNLQQIFFYTAIFILLPVFYNLIYLLFTAGFENTIIKSRFDISYFNMSLPFIIILLVFTFLEKHETLENK